MMRKIRLFIKDNVVQIVETVILLVAIVLPIVIDAKMMFADYVKNTSIDPDNFLWVLILDMKNGYISIAFAIVILIIIRKYNSEKIIMNRRNIYHKYPYAWYWYSAKILGISRCELKQVPLYLQVKLIVNATFDNYLVEDNKELYIEDNESISSVEKVNFSKNKRVPEVNMVISDTYLIDFKQLPREKRMLPTVRIVGGNTKDGNRYIVPSLVKTIKSAIDELPEGICLNVFATLNPMNCYQISKNAFCTEGRGNIKHLYIFQQKGNCERFFEEKGKKVY